jgi:hypothetical protein
MTRLNQITKLVLFLALPFALCARISRGEEREVAQPKPVTQAPAPLAQESFYRACAAALVEFVKAVTLTRGESSVEKPVDPDMRTWIDATGRRKTRAKLIDFVEGQVYLQRETGEVSSISIAGLSPADQKFIRSKHRERTLPKSSDTASSRTLARRGTSTVGSSDSGVSPSQLRRYVELGYKPNPTNEDIRELLLLDARVAVQKGLMTPEQYEEYTGQPY